MYLAITFSLNILLTLMIVGRLALCNQEFRNAMGVTSRGHMRTSSRAGEWCKAIAAIFVESCAPYAISLLLYLIVHYINSPMKDIFYPIFIETQVRVALRFPDAVEIFGHYYLIVVKTGHRSIPYHPTTRQPNRYDKRPHHRVPDCRFSLF